MKKLTALILSASLLSGCVLTRVSSSAHNEEVQNLGLVGLTHAEAITKAERAGFTCYKDEMGPYKSSRVGQEVKNRGCWKKSAELICPQFRRVHFEFSVNDGKVVAVWSDINEQGCF